MAKNALLSTLSASLLLSLTPLPSYSSESPECAEASEDDIAALFDRWNDSLATLDPDQVVDNYSPDAVLLPTLSDETRDTPDLIRDYFVDFVAQEPQGVIDERNIKIGCNAAYDAGVYTFTLVDEEGNETEETARYSFVYSYHDGEWLIEHHHSSLMPE
ncbi:SgcJ/EcaC family oxidoreductase [Euhalothece natronophila Z-M001]|uniref:SgcJ/EcaC family oxidoreductase n=1 Tax=Euhalothece natronophila Z-M001 TaxID=522448 RepID=A0A5B8NMR9_9CHRO|nr:SgcJ/EcaC family oxidoreductase [Euhalothece natronophila]QDZ39575.1 SgcJ/EcaC family oxidoreductase [Euhalothece natronophila Z-M001]